MPTIALNNETIILQNVDGNNGYLFTSNSGKLPGSSFDVRFRSAVDHISALTAQTNQVDLAGNPLPGNVNFVQGNTLP
jgi:hypothetical protein